MYKELVLKLSKGIKWVKIQQPCSDNEILKAEKYVGYAFPEELKSLLREMNGDKWLILSVDEIIENVKLNRKYFRELFESDYNEEEYMNRVDRFVFFAGNGCGDYYCYRVSEGGIVDDGTIYIWKHEELGEECCWHPVAHSMKEFIERYYNDEI